MIVLDILNTPESTASHTLGGNQYELTTKFNIRDNRWSLTITNGVGNVLLSGARLMENQGIVGRYYIEDFTHGDLFIVRMQNDGKPVGRHNLGIDKPYQLIYLTSEEIEEISKL